MRRSTLRPSPSWYVRAGRHLWHLFSVRPEPARHRASTWSPGRHRRPEAARDAFALMSSGDRGRRHRPARPRRSAGVIFFGAMKMRALQSYRLAMTAAVLAAVPGLPAPAAAWACRLPSRLGAGRAVRQQRQGVVRLGLSASPDHRRAQRAEHRQRDVSPMVRGHHQPQAGHQETANPAHWQDDGRQSGATATRPSPAQSRPATAPRWPPRPARPGAGPATRGSAAAARRRATRQQGQHAGQRADSAQIGR